MRPNRRPEFQLGSWRIPVSRQRQPSRLEVPEWAAEEIADGFRRMRDEPDMLERLGIRDQLAAARRREIEERYAE